MKDNEINLIGKKVLDFYSQLAFNRSSSPSITANEIKSANTISYYFGSYESCFNKERTILEMGCGIGWMSNMINYYHQSSVVGIDFNPAAIAFAKETAKKLAFDGGSRNVQFTVADLFKYESDPYDIVISIGVLHHTGNIQYGIKKVCDLTQSKGYVMIGLYHLHGRAPFLNHFKKLQKKGYTEDQLFTEYRKLDTRHKDEMLARSWFRDQVLHIYESQHTLKEINEILNANGVKVIASSINNFNNINDISELYKMEETLYDRGMESLNSQKYYPGFFITIGEKL